MSNKLELRHTLLTGAPVASETETALSTQKRMNIGRSPANESSSVPKNKLTLEIDHDHYCMECNTCWGCKDQYCHLPTEKSCIQHGGMWNTDAAVHFHECRQCDEHDAEVVSTFDWTHDCQNCRQPRLWPCEKHRTVDTQTRDLADAGRTSLSVKDPER